MEIDSNYITYFYFKVVDTMIYTKNLKELLDYLELYFNIIPESILQALEITLESNKNYMDAKMKENAYYIVHYYKNKCEISNENRNEISELTNSIIRKINISDSSKIKELVKVQYQIRFMDKIITNRALRNLNLSLESIKNMKVTDLNLLIAHSCFYDEKSFDYDIHTYSSRSLFYISSVNMIIAEYPDILKNILFRKRVKQVISKINITDRKIKKIYTKFRKNIDIG